MCTEEDVFQVKSVEPFTTPFFCNINVGPCYLIGQPQVKYIICNGNLSASTKCKCKERYLHIDRFGNDPWAPDIQRNVPECRPVCGNLDPCLYLDKLFPGRLGCLRVIKICDIVQCFIKRHSHGKRQIHPLRETIIDPSHT